MTRRSAASWRGSLTPVASRPSKVQLLSSRARPTKRIDCWLPSPVLMAPGASAIRLAQCRPLSGISRICCAPITVPTTAEVLSIGASTLSTVTEVSIVLSCISMLSVRLSPTAQPHVLNRDSAEPGLSGRDRVDADGQQGERITSIGCRLDFTAEPGFLRNDLHFGAGNQRAAAVGDGTRKCGPVKLGREMEVKPEENDEDENPDRHVNLRAAARAACSTVNSHERGLANPRSNVLAGYG